MIQHMFRTLLAAAAGATLLVLAGCDAMPPLAAGSLAEVDASKHFTRELIFRNGADTETFSRSGTWESVSKSWSSSTGAFTQANGSKGSYTYDPTTCTLSLSVTHLWLSGEWTALAQTITVSKPMAITERTCLDAWSWDPALGRYRRTVSTSYGTTVYTSATTVSFRNGAYAYELKETSAVSGTTTSSVVTTAAGSYETHGAVSGANGSAVTYLASESSRSTSTNGGAAAAGTPIRSTWSFSVVNRLYAATAPSAYSR